MERKVTIIEDLEGRKKDMKKMQSTGGIDMMYDLRFQCTMIRQERC